MTHDIDRRFLLALTAASLLAGRAQAADGLRIEANYHRWPQLRGWLASLLPMIHAWWPQIGRTLGESGGEAPRLLRVDLMEIKPGSIAAMADGDRIYIDAPYVLANRDNPDMLRMIAHELVHVAQGYPKGAQPHWLTEGIADYVRYYVLFPDDPGRAFDPARENWQEGYSPAAGLLAWAEGRKPGTVARLNAAMRASQNGEAALDAVLGMNTDALWAAYLHSHPAAADAARRQAYRAGLKH